MTTVLMNKMHLVGSGYAEMPQDGKRYRYQINRWRDDSGQEWGEIVSREQVPDVGPYMWIPSYHIEPAEAQYLQEEYEYERAHPHPIDREQLAEHRAKMQGVRTLYDEARDARAAAIKRSPRTAGR